MNMSLNAMCGRNRTYSFVAPGSLDVDRLEELLHFRPEDDTESTTVGGLAAEWLGHVPKVGENRLSATESVSMFWQETNSEWNRCAYRE